MIELSDGDDRAQLLYDWLNELLYRFEVEHLLLNQFEVRLTETGLHAQAHGEPVDPQRHALAHAPLRRSHRC